MNQKVEGDDFEMEKVKLPNVFNEDVDISDEEEQIEMQKGTAEEVKESDILSVLNNNLL